MPGVKLDSQIVIRLVDDRGAPVAGAVVTWQLLAGGGALPVHLDTTGLDGTAGATWKLGLTEVTQILRVSAVGVPPVRVEFTPSLLHVHSIAVGFAFACGLDDAGSAWCWGENTYGKLGASDPSAVGPTKVGGDSLHFVQLSLGDDHACGLTSDGTTWCWGSFSNGQLGDGRAPAFAGTATPVRPLGLPPLLSLSSGDNGTCGLDASGQLWCWGAIPGRPQTTTPVPTFAGMTFRQIAVDYTHGCGIDTSGEVVCWGDNSLGALGNDSMGGSTTTPHQIAVPMHAVQVASGDGGSCAIDTGASLYCWGYIANVTSPEWRTLGASHPAQMPDSPARAVSLGWYCGAIWTVGGHPRMLCRGSSSTPDDVEAIDEPIAEVALGWRSLCLRTTAGGIYCKTYSDLSHGPYFDWAASAIPAP